MEMSAIFKNIGWRTKDEKHLSDIPASIKQYAEQKPFFTHMKSPGQVLESLQIFIKDIVAEFMPKLS